MIVHCCKEREKAVGSIPGLPVSGCSCEQDVLIRISITGANTNWRYMQTSAGIWFVEQLLLQEPEKAPLEHKGKSFGLAILTK